MEFSGERLVLSPSDLINHLECRHLTHLDLEVAKNRLDLVPTRTDTGDLVARKGGEHERAYLESLRAAGREVVEIANEPGLPQLLHGAEQTLDAMRGGA